eukprot:COSAG06_NODE_390_length_16395_cov_6.904332_2_plen_185_part_00
MRLVHLTGRLWRSTVLSSHCCIVELGPTDCGNSGSVCLADWVCCAVLCCAALARGWQALLVRAGWLEMKSSARTRRLSVSQAPHSRLSDLHACTVPLLAWGVSSVCAHLLLLLSFSQDSVDARLSPTAPRRNLDGTYGSLITNTVLVMVYCVVCRCGGAAWRQAQTPRRTGVTSRQPIQPRRID